MVGVTAKKTTRIIKGSGNVFADLGLPDSEELLFKAQIASEIARTLRDRGLTQVEAGKLIGVDQAKVSALLRGRLNDFSVDRLIRFVTLLGQDVEFRISRPHKRRTGRLKVTSAA
jgi:predicted XRE-type DNA-binding protein